MVVCTNPVQVLSTKKTTSTSGFLSKPPSSSQRLRRRREQLVLPPARPPFFFASDGLGGLGCEGNGWLSRQRSLVFFRFRVVFPADGRKVEASSVPWNKILRPSLRLVVFSAGAGDGLVRLDFVGFEDQVGASDLGDSSASSPSSMAAAAVSAWPPVVASAVVPLALRRRYEFFCLPSVVDGVAFLPMEMSSDAAAGDWRLVMVGESVERGFGVSVGGFGAGEVFLDYFLCVGAPILYGFLVAGCAHAFSTFVGLEASGIAVGLQWSFCFLQGAVDGCLVRSIYQRESKSGWSLVPTCFGGPVPLQGVSSSGESGILAVLVASDSSSSGDVMADGHFLQPGRSASTRHVGCDVLLKTASKNYVPSPERRSASSCGLRPAAARNTGRSLQRLEHNLFFFQGCLCKSWAVITETYE